MVRPISGAFKINVHWHFLDAGEGEKGVAILKAWITSAHKVSVWQSTIKRMNTGIQVYKKLGQRNVRRHWFDFVSFFRSRSYILSRVICLFFDLNLTLTLPLFTLLWNHYQFMLSPRHARFPISMYPPPVARDAIMSGPCWSAKKSSQWCEVLCCGCVAAVLRAWLLRWVRTSIHLYKNDDTPRRQYYFYRYAKTPGFLANPIRISVNFSFRRPYLNCVRFWYRSECRQMIQEDWTTHATADLVERGEQSMCSVTNEQTLKWEEVSERMRWSTGGDIRAIYLMFAWHTCIMTQEWVFSI